jgi:hypothetical protein
MDEGFFAAIGNFFKKLFSTEYDNVSDKDYKDIMEERRVNKRNASAARGHWTGRGGGAGGAGGRGGGLRPRKWPGRRR